MSDENDDPRAVEAAFYAAFGARDLTAMQQLWADSPDVSCIHPGGPLLQGHAAVLRSWTEILDGAAQPEVLYTELLQIRHGDLAVHTVEERIRPARGRSDHTRVIATNVYRRTSAGWRLLQHHASLPLVSTAPRPRVTH